MSLFCLAVLYSLYLSQSAINIVGFSFYTDRFYIIPKRIKGFEQTENANTWHHLFDSDIKERLRNYFVYLFLKFLSYSCEWTRVSVVCFLDALCCVIMYFYVLPYFSLFAALFLFIVFSRRSCFIVLVKSFNYKVLIFKACAIWWYWHDCRMAADAFS